MSILIFILNRLLLKETINKAYYCHKGMCKLLVKVSVPRRWGSININYAETNKNDYYDNFINIFAFTKDDCSVRNKSNIITYI
jgi:hypothetical protein